MFCCSPERPSGWLRRVPLAGTLNFLDEVGFKNGSFMFYKDAECPEHTCWPQCKEEGVFTVGGGGRERGLEREG